MKALVYTNPNEVTYRDEPEPVRDDGEVVLRIDAVGICGSDMHAYHGRDPRRRPPLILGHELCGTIVEGDGAGGRFTVNPLITCGRCHYCLTGRNNLCANRTMIGMTRPGGFAERMSIPAASLIAIPHDMTARQAALAEPAATALHATDRAARALARPLPEARALVIGGGAVGLLAALLLQVVRLPRSRLAETNPLRRESRPAPPAARPTIRASDGARSADDSMDSCWTRSAASRRATPRSTRCGRAASSCTSASWIGRARSTCASSRSPRSR
jgi:alcohol dehydrogenase